MTSVPLRDSEKENTQAGCFRLLRMKKITCQGCQGFSKIHTRKLYSMAGWKIHHEDVLPLEKLHFSSCRDTNYSPKGRKIPNWKLPDSSLESGAVIPQLPTPSWMFWRLKPNSSDVVVQDLGCCIFFRGVFVFLVRLAGGSTTLAAGSTTLAVSKCLVNLFPPKELFPDLFLGLNYSPLVFPQEFFENSTLI